MAQNGAREISGTQGDIVVSTLVRESGFVMPQPHCHDYFELFYIANGTCRFFIENNMYDISGGDFMLIPPGVFHYTRYLGGSCKRSMIHFGKSDLGERIISLFPGGEDFFSSMRIFQAQEAYREQLDAHFAKMVSERKIADGASGQMLRILLQELFLLCVRWCTFLHEIPADIHTTDRQIVLAAQFISGHYMERIDAHDIAAAAGYSPNYLSRKFRKSVGTGIHEYLVFTRLQQAALELLTTDDSVTEIAFRCGFSDSNYFKDAFKRNYGVSPRAYRRRG